MSRISQVTYEYSRTNLQWSSWISTPKNPIVGMTTASWRFTPISHKHASLLRYDRVCWHRDYTELHWSWFILPSSFSALQLTPSSRGGIAGSHFRALTKIPDCCHLKVFGPYLSSDEADHSSESTKRSRLGKLLNPQRSDTHMAYPYGETDQTYYQVQISFDYSAFRNSFILTIIRLGKVTILLLSRSPWISSSRKMFPNHSTCMSNAHR